MSVFLKSIIFENILSFDKAEVELKDLNIFIGHNGSGKSNFIEALSLLQSAPQGIVGSIRQGGGVADWIWKGGEKGAAACIDTVIQTDPEMRVRSHGCLFRYFLSFVDAAGKFEIVEEKIAFFYLKLSLNTFKAKCWTNIRLARLHETL